MTPLVSFFEVVLNWFQKTAKELIGESYRGIITSDHYSCLWLDYARATTSVLGDLKRDLTAIAERIGASHEIGEALLRRQHRLFRWWYRVQDGALSREQFIHQVSYLRQGFKATLDEAAALPIDPNEQSPWAKTVRTCRQLLKVEPALWTFVLTVGMEPTNNAAERALRTAVI